ncbi:MAG: hypothetical protein ABI877_20940 [Gemmatimonadaceae bacterium]
MGHPPANVVARGLGYNTRTVSTPFDAAKVPSASVKFEGGAS